MAADLDCAICMEVLEDPARLRPCGHRFCRSCLDPALAAGAGTGSSSSDAAAEKKRCPLCRQAATAVEADAEMAQAIASRSLQCPSCMAAVPAAGLRAHKETCKAEIQAAQAVLEKARAQVKADAPQRPNRSTFKCPFPDCPADHMDGKDLCGHFETAHPGASCAAVCPVCVSMPWGDPNYISRDVVSHIRLRHKFTYDEYVDYQEAGDEDAILQAVLRQSLEQR